MHTPLQGPCTPPGRRSAPEGFGPAPGVPPILGRRGAATSRRVCPGAPPTSRAGGEESRGPDPDSGPPPHAPTPGPAAPPKHLPASPRLRTRSPPGRPRAAAEARDGWRAACLFKSGSWLEPAAARRRETPDHAARPRPSPVTWPGWVPLRRVPGALDGLGK